MPMLCMYIGMKLKANDGERGKVKEQLYVELRVLFGARKGPWLVICFGQFDEGLCHVFRYYVNQ